MAYITTETVKSIRNTLKKEFPEVKFSVRKDGHSEVIVAVMKSPYFEDGVNYAVNHYWLGKIEDDAVREFLKRVDEIVRTEGNYYDNSDTMTDYFNVAYYYTIEVGKWDKPHVKV